MIVGSAYSYLQEWLPNVAQHAVRNGLTDFVGLGRIVLSYPDLPADVLSGTKLRRKSICRTFSDCTTGPRLGMVSGCYPLDPFYMAKPEAADHPEEEARGPSSGQSIPAIPTRRSTASSEPNRLAGPRDVRIGWSWACRWTSMPTASRQRAVILFFSIKSSYCSAKASMASTTMKRIAGELGVSITTVSKVLNNHDDISPATRARVLAKVEELGYRPNAVARSLTLRRTHTLGIVIPDLMHSFFVEIIAGIEPVASERGYGLLLCSSGENSGQGAIGAAAAARPAGRRHRPRAGAGHRQRGDPAAICTRTAPAS